MNINKLNKRNIDETQKKLGVVYFDFMIFFDFLFISLKYYYICIYTKN